ncbi:hypothetical protein MBLNU457_6206t1 [Dothideomycetes sp. NU457]
MAQKDEHDFLNLGNAIKIIDEHRTGPWNPSVSSALETILEATRDLGQRDYLNEQDTLSKVTRLCATVSEETSEDGKEGRLKLLRCIGNLVADNDHNRAFVMADTGCLKDLQHRMRVEAMQQGPEGIREADTALSVLYNLCIDNAEIQQAALKKELHISVFEYLHGRPWDFAEESEEDLFENALLTLNEILQHKSEVNHPEHLTPKFTSEVLRLPCMDGILDVLFETAALGIFPYLQDAAFQEAILNNRQLPLLWSLLEKAAYIARLGQLETSSAPEIKKAVFEVIIGMSLLPSYPDHFQNDYASIRILCSACIHTESDTKEASISTAACILLGNFATKDAAYASTVLSKLDLTSLFDFISLKAYKRNKQSGQVGPTYTIIEPPAPGSVPADTVYLHAAGGMLRHISKSQHIRESHFTDPAALQASIALSQYSDPEVQIQGLRLFRHLIATNISTMTHSINNNYTSTLIRVFTASSDGRVKLEVSRTVVKILHALVSKQPDPGPDAGPSTAASTQITTAQYGEGNTWKDELPDSRTELLQSFLATPNLIEPLIFAITLPAHNTQNNGSTDFARAEGWFGLVLLKLAGSTGTALVVHACQQQGEVLDALRGIVSDQLVSGMEEMVVAERSRSSTDERRRARDNAIAFAAGVIRDVYIDGGLRMRVKAVLAEAGVDIR